MKESKSKIAIVADIHANYYCLKKTLQDIEKRGVKEILFLGDYITDGFENNKVLDVIKNYKYAIAGNREISIANYDGHSWKNLEQFKNMLYTYQDITEENRNYIKSLSPYKIIMINGKKICLSHGTPFDSRECVDFNSFVIFDKLIQEYLCDVYLFGHTHEAYCTTYKNKMFINPGSVILPADGPTSKYGIIDLENMKYEAISIPYDFKELREYYRNSEYFKQNKEWCNILIYTNETGIDHMCSFIDFIKKKAEKEGIPMKDSIPNDLWHTSFLEFVKMHQLPIY